MCPNTLDRVRRQAIPYKEPNAASQRPELAALMLEVINRGSLYDTHLCIFIGYLLQAEAHSVSSMIQGVISFRTKIDLVLAGLGAKYSGDDFDLASAVMHVAAQAAEKRNIIAHYIHATTDDLPDAILLIEPEAEVERSFRWLKEDMSRVHPFESITPDRKRIWVYRAKDFQDIIALQDSAARSLTLLLHFLKDTHGDKEEMRRLLSLEQPTMTALSQMRAGKVRR